MAEPRPADRLTLDLITSYLAAAAKVGSWAYVIHLVSGTHFTHMLALIVTLRATFTLLNHFSLNLGAVVVRLAAVESSPHVLRADVPVQRARSAAEATPLVLPYANPTSAQVRLGPLGQLYSASSWLVGALSIVAVLAAFGLALIVVHPFSNESFAIALPLGIGIALRATCDAYSGWLQVQGRLWLDNLFVVLAECLWIGLVFAWSAATDGMRGVHHGPIGTAALASAVVLFACRQLSAWLVCNRPVASLRAGGVRRDMGRLVRAGLPITLGNLADYLYGPVSMLVVAAFLTTQDAAAYGVAIYFDSVLLLLVAGVAAPLLPRIADASARHDVARVRKLYITASLACLGVLALAATCVVLFAPWILSVWLKNPPPGVTAVLPIVLLHTVIGGTAGVARSVLVGIGAHRAYAVSALVGGLLNVALGLLFVTQFDMGLAGIAWATVIAVALRCAVWMPWFVLRRLRPAL